MSLVLRTIHSPEQKTKSAKSGLNTVFKPLLTIPPSATSCTHRLTCRFGRCFSLCAEVSTGDPHPLQRRQKGLFNSGVLEKRELFGERRKEWSVYYKFYKIYSNTEFLSTRRALATLSTVYNPDTIKCRGYLFYLVLTLLTFDQEE